MNQAYNAIKPTKTQDGKWLYNLSKGVSITAQDNKGSVFVNSENGQIYAENLKGADVKGNDQNNNISFKKCQINNLDLGNGDDTVRAVDSTFANQVKFGDSAGDTFNVDNKKKAFGDMKDYCDNMLNASVKTMSNDAKSSLNQTYSNIQKEQTAKEAEQKAAQQTKEAEQKAKAPGTPAKESVTVDPWSNNSSENNCLYNIVKNNYPNLSEKEIMNACKQLAEYNNIEDMNLIYTGDNVKLPELTFGNDGAVNGCKDYKTPEPSAQTTEKTADGKTIVSDDFVGPLTPDQIRESDATKEAEKPEEVPSDTTVADGCDDGKISGKEKAKNLAKGVGNFFKGIGQSFKEHPVKSTAITLAAAGACCIPGVGPYAAAGLATYGLVKGTGTVVKGAVDARNATTDAEAQKAWQSIGSGTTEAVISGVALKGSVGAIKAAKAASAGAEAGVLPETGATQALPEAGTSATSSSTGSAALPEAGASGAKAGASGAKAGASGAKAGASGAKAGASGAKAGASGAKAGAEAGASGAKAGAKAGAEAAVHPKWTSEGIQSALKEAYRNGTLKQEYRNILKDIHPDSCKATYDNTSELVTTLSTLFKQFSKV